MQPVTSLPICAGGGAPRVESGATGVRNIALRHGTQLLSPVLHCTRVQPATVRSQYAPAGARGGAGKHSRQAHKNIMPYWPI